MKKKNSAGKQKGGKRAALLIAGLVGATLLMSMLCAALMEKGSIPEEKTNLCACVIVGLVSLMSCGLIASRASEKKLLRGIFGAGIYAGLLLIGNLLFFGVGYADVLPILLSILAAGILGSAAGSLRRKKRRFV